MKELSLELMYGVTLGEKTHKKVELLRTNGVAEKIFTDKFPEKPYSWIGTVISTAAKKIGTEAVGVSARQEYLDTGHITIPQIVQKLPLAEANTLLVEIHRRVWKNELPEQETVCKYCGTKSIMQIDLNKIEYSEQDIKDFLRLEEKEEKLIVVSLPEGFEFSSPKKYGTDELSYPEYDGKTYNRFKFRVPVLEDAIRNEKIHKESVDFWRRIAFDCFHSAEEVDKNGEVISELPKSVIIPFGLTLYNELLYSKDLAAIREGLRESIPTLPFYYEDTCTGCKRETPVTMEPSNFFSE